MVRYHNVYGPLGTYDGGREKLLKQFVEKSEAKQIIRKKLNLGDSEQTRSFMYISDCVRELKKYLILI